jgi:site-specific DNA recombinase
MTATRAAIYIRVSSDRQEQDGTSLVTQEESCRRYADEHGYAVVEVFSDTHTGAQYRERPGLSRLRTLVQAGSVEVVIAHALDRLSRNQAHTYILAEEFSRVDTQLKFVTEDFEDSAVGRFIRSAKSFAAEVEREKMIERSVRGRHARARSGKMIPGARPLYGYQWRDADKTALDVEPAKGPVVQRIYREAMTGKPLRAIGRDLTGEGIPTPTGKVNWSPESISQILHHPNYTGDAYTWAWRPNDQHHYRVFDRESAIPLPPSTVPQLVDPATWHAVQEQLQRNKQMARRNSHNPENALLRAGFVRCGHCGRSMIVKPSGRRRGYNYLNYVCCGRGWRTDSCLMPTIATHILDAAVWGKVTTILTDPDVVARELERLQGDDPTERELESVDRSVRDIERRQTNLAQQMSLIDDPDASAPLVVEIKQLAAHLKTLRNEREEIVRQQDIRQNVLVQLGDLRAWCRQVAGQLEMLTYDEKRDALLALGIEVKVYSAKSDQRYEITVRLPIVSPTMRS